MSALCFLLKDLFLITIKLSIELQANTSHCQYWNNAALIGRYFV
jgi:hypothetical protein